MSHAGAPPGRQGDPPPLTDAFGTRLSAADLLGGLDALGLDAARLSVRDDGVVLEHPVPDVREETVARGLVWLVSRFSPFIPVRVAAPSEPDGPRFADLRRRPTRLVHLVEATDPEVGLGPAVADLVGRLGAGGAPVAPGPIVRPTLADPVRAGLTDELAERLGADLPPAGHAPGSATVTVLIPGARGGLEVAHPPDAAGGGTHFLLWLRPGGARGIRPAVCVAASRDRDAIAWLAAALTGTAPPRSDDEPEILLDGLVWRAARRPTLAVAPGGDGEPPIRVDPDRCTECGICEAICPEDYLGPAGRPVVDDPAGCTRCYECVDACPDDALRPVAAADTATRAAALRHRPTWLSRLAGLPGPSFPAPFPPSYLLPRIGTAGPPRVVLGLAVMTMQEHAAVLLKDGEVLGAVELERLDRNRHAGWHPPDRPGVTAAMDPTILVEETFCRPPIRALLETHGLTLDDVDLFALNGLHGRHVGHVSFVDAAVPIPMVRAGRVVHVPHHLAHAASAYRASGFDRAWVVTIDGRGDRECAAVWRGEDGQLRLVDTILSLVDRSIGGVYEGVTRLLGFGGHGQGSTMALAAFGEPTMDFGDVLALDADGTVRIHETAVTDRFGHLSRRPDEPLTAAHHDLAASLQAALEAVAVELVRRNAGTGPLDALCLAGGVALNCRMNERLRRELRPARIFAQPGANDAGTALGAALEAWADAHGGRAPAVDRAHLGPAFDDRAIEAALVREGLSYRRVASIAEAVAERIAEGEVVCWYQGEMEFGPRALGGRSILADPRREAIHGRVNALKGREPWRPFGPSILAGHEADWLEGAFDARYMLFTLPVRASRRDEVPAVVHVDGTTRPQVVHRETLPRYHAMISAFHARTGIPMVLNTSFNRRKEPIVCTPGDAVDAFLGLGADALAIGDFLAEPVPAPARAPAPEMSLAALPGGRRLALRLTARCDLDCGHCTVRDLRHRADRSPAAALEALEAGRRSGCDELVVLRGEAALWDGLPDLVRAARRMGYSRVQLQTAAHALAETGRRRALLEAGVDTFEVMLLAADESTHDRLTATPGSWRRTLPAVRALAAAGCDVLLSVPVLAGNMRHAGGIVSLSARLGLRRLQFVFPRPVESAGRVTTEPIPRLAVAARCVAAAAERAAAAGIAVTTEAFPLCLLPESLHGSPDAREDFSRHRIDDLHVLHEDGGVHRASQRPVPPPCRACHLEAACPKTWGLYLELFGSGELRPVSRPPIP